MKLGALGGGRMGVEDRGGLVHGKIIMRSRIRLK